MKKFTLLIIPLFISAWCNAQQSDPSVLSAAGRIDNTDKISLEWTLGEVSVQTAEGRNKTFTEGYHQPLKVMPISDEAIASTYNIVVAPNPVNSILNFRIKSEEDSKVILKLTDLNGKTLFMDNASGKDDTKEIDMSGYVTGTYLLNIQDAKGAIVKVFKVIKVN